MNEEKRLPDCSNGHLNYVISEVKKRKMQRFFNLYVSRWTCGIPLIALVFPTSHGQAISGSGLLTLISPTVLPPVTAAFV